MKTYLFLAAILLAPPAFASPADPSLPAGPAPENVWQVSPGVFRGARIENADQMRYLVNELHVKTIVNLQGGDDKSPWIGNVVDFFEKGETNAEIDAEAKLARNAGIAPANYVRAPLNSLHELTPQETARVFQMINIMKDPARQPVYVHCAHGADRTGLVVGLYELVTGQKTVMQAYQEMIDRGHDLWHAAFTANMDRAFFEQAAKIMLGKAAEKPAKISP